jgi:hypothetical protein
MLRNTEKRIELCEECISNITSELNKVIIYHNKQIKEDEKLTPQKFIDNNIDILEDSKYQDKYKRL